MSAVEGGHIENIDEANQIIRQIVEARNRKRAESTEAATVADSSTQDWDEVAHEITRDASIEYQSPVFFDAENSVENPKDVVGSGKLPLHLWPMTASAMGSIALLNGALKYGRSNWREIGVRASVYVDACQRHLAAWFEGEDSDEEGVPHLSSALACLAILVDAQAAGKLKDDRQYPGGYRRLVSSLTPHVARLREVHQAKSPKHWTITDR